MENEERIPSETIDDWPMILKEYPFIRKGMTPEEYDKEKDYFFKNYASYRDGSYTPLWKQETET